MHRANPVTGRQWPLPAGRSLSLAQSLGADQPPCPRFEQAIDRRRPPGYGPPREDPSHVKPANARLAALGTTIFTVMSALAAEHDAINLGQGFPDTDGPEDLLDEAARALREGPNQYPPMPGLPELRAAVAAHDRRFYDLQATPAQVVVTCGATEAIAACLMALLDPGDEIVLIEPLYDTYLPMVRALGAIPRLVRLDPPDWVLPRAALEAAFGPRTKAILLNSPMNPTGKVFTRAELGFLAELIARHDAYAICDEVYEHLVFDGHRHIPLMTLPGMAERTMRIGLAKGSNYFAGLAAALQAKRDRLAGGLAALGMEVLPCHGSYFVTADFRPLGFTGDDVAFCRHITETARVTAVPVTAFYDGADPPRTYARFAFCKQDAVLDEAVARLARRFSPGQ